MISGANDKELELSNARADILLMCGSETIKIIDKEIERLNNVINELEDLLEIKKARMLNENDYSKSYLEGYDTIISASNLSHSGIMLETVKSSVVKTCDDILDKLKELKEGK